MARFRMADLSETSHFFLSQWLKVHLNCADVFVNIRENSPGDCLDIYDFEPNLQNCETVFCLIPCFKECVKLPVLGHFHLCQVALLIKSFVFLEKSVLMDSQKLSHFL